jgi:2-keto-3-deoxy-L-rhamnonate aldolase RhmA
MPRGHTKLPAWRNPNAIANASSAIAAASLLLGEQLRRKAARGCALGTFSIELSSPSSIAALALAGFDFVVLDMEHSPRDFATLEPLLLAAHAAGIAALVRPCGDSMDVIGKVLDMGAHGIMAPHVDSAARAREIVEQTRFPPLGRRSFSPLSRFDSLTEPLDQLNRATYLVLQIEGAEALERIDSIAAVPGVDAVFVGPYDLALSLGIPPNSAGVAKAAHKAVASVPTAVALGVYVDDPSTCGVWASHRFTLQCVSFDGRMFASGARAVLENARKSVGKRATRRNSESSQ